MYFHLKNLFLREQGSCGPAHRIICITNMSLNCIFSPVPDSHRFEWLKTQKCKSKFLYICLPSSEQILKTRFSPERVFKLIFINLNQRFSAFIFFNVSSFLKISRRILFQFDLKVEWGIQVIQLLEDEICQNCCWWDQSFRRCRTTRSMFVEAFPSTLVFRLVPWTSS